MDACAQGLLFNGFGAIGDRSLLEQLPFNLGVRIGRDEYRRHWVANRNEPVKKLDPAHLRHSYVDDQTTGFVYRVRTQKIACRREGGSPVTKRIYESLHRYQHVLVIVYDRYQFGCIH